MAFIEQLEEEAEHLGTAPARPEPQIEPVTTRLMRARRGQRPTKSATSCGRSITDEFASYGGYQSKTDRTIPLVLLERPD